MPRNTLCNTASNTAVNVTHKSSIFCYHITIQQYRFVAEFRKPGLNAISHASTRFEEISTSSFHHENTHTRRCRPVSKLHIQPLHRPRRPCRPSPLWNHRLRRFNRLDPYTIPLVSFPNSQEQKEGMVILSTKPFHLDCSCFSALGVGVLSWAFCSFSSHIQEALVGVTSVFCESVERRLDWGMVVVDGFVCGFVVGFGVGDEAGLLLSLRDMLFWVSEMRNIELFYCGFWCWGR